MRKICFHNRKGGVGKTTLAGCCGYLAARRIRTVLVDADGQGNLTSWYVTGSYQYELADFLMSDGRLSIQDIALPLEEELWILPTSGGSGLLKDYAEMRLFREPTVFDRLNEALAAAAFDLAIYDLSPGMSQLERCVISSCDETVIPVMGEYFAIDGLESAVQDIEKINEGFSRQVRYRRLVVNGVNRSIRRHVDSLEEYEKLDFELFTVPQDTDIAKCQFEHKALPIYSPKSKSLPELERLTIALTEEVKV